MQIFKELREQEEKTPEASEVMPAEGVKVQDVHKAEDIAAVFFKMQQPRLKILLSKMSSKQLRRVIFNAVSYPMVEKEYAPRTKEERDALYLVHEMTLNKTIMQLSFEMNKADNALKEQENLTTISIDNTLVGELKSDENV